MEKICVAVRIRPPATEVFTKLNEGISWSWKVEDNRVSLCKSQGSPIASTCTLTFDHVFDESSSNSKVYELLTKDIITAAVNGFNGTVFAYGQTSSGKTFTMNGSEGDPGIIIRAVRDVFHTIETIQDREFLIRVSYMEIYNEEINDLLSVGNRKLRIHESLERGIFVAGLREEIVSTAEQVLNHLKLGEENRHFGETNMNARSSRSHTVFRMVIESKIKSVNGVDEKNTCDAVRVSVLNLVDLAGSERIAKTGACGVRLKEGKHINKSLMALGNVINKLSDGAKQKGHIPYRDSKLTRILQPALGGNTKTSIICTVAPEEIHIEETKSTLQFASRAKCITNCAQVNEILTNAALLKRQKLEIEELQQKLEGSRAEVLEQEILKLRNEMLQYEQDREKLELELEEERKTQKERDQYIMTQQIQIKNLSSLVPSTDSNYLYSYVNDNTSQGDKSFDSFVVKRSKLSDQEQISPYPEFIPSNSVDEDAWIRLNKGYVVDLDSAPTPSSCNCGIKLEELEAAKKENILLTEKLSHLERNAEEMQQIMCRSVAKCNDIYRGFLSSLEELEAKIEPSTAKMISLTSGMGLKILSIMEDAINSADMCLFDDVSVKRDSKEISNVLRDLCKFMEMKKHCDWMMRSEGFEERKRKHLQEIEEFGCALVNRENNIMSLYGKLKAVLDRI